MLLTLVACASPEPPHCEGTQIKECYAADPEQHATCSDRVLQDCADRDAVCEETSSGPECIARGLCASGSCTSPEDAGQR